MDNLSVVIPSYKRAHLLVGKDYFYYAKYVVCKSQEAEYLQILPRERLIVIDDSEDGSIGKKRNWILKNIPRPLLMIDDDVSGLMMTEGIREVEGRKGQKVLKAVEKIKLTPDEALDVIINGFNLAQDWGCVLWGINVNTDGRNYQQYKPFALTQPILGPFQGHLNHELLFDEQAGTKEDYDMSIQVLNKYKKVLRINKFSYDCEHGDNKGGIVSQRTLESELGFAEYLMKKWGTKIIKYDLNPSNMTEVLNGRVRVPIRGV